MFIIKKSKPSKILFVAITVFLCLSIVKPSKALAPLAISLMNPAVLGSVVVAGGILSGTAAHYAPAIYETGQSLINSVGEFHRSLYQVQKFALSSGAEYFVGRAEEVKSLLGDAGTTVNDWISSHSTDVPLISDSLDIASASPPTTSLGNGDIYTATDDGVTYRIDSSSYTNAYVMYPYTGKTCEETYVQMGVYPEQTSTRIRFNPHKPDGSSLCNLPTLNISSSTPTTSAVTFPLPSVYTPQTFADSINLQDPVSVALEIDKIITSNPTSFEGSNFWSTTDTQNAINLVNNEIATAAATAATAESLASPTDVALQIAAAEATAAAELAEIEATPIEETVITATTPSLPAPLTMPTMPEYTPVEFLAPIKTALDDLTLEMQSHEPFATFGTLSTTLEALSVAPVAPVLQLNLPYMGDFDVDLAPFDSLAQFTRGTVGFLVLVGLSFFVIKIWV